MRPSRPALFATTVLCSAVACSLDYTVGPFDGGSPATDGGGASDTSTDHPSSAVPKSCATPLTCIDGRSCCESQIVPGGRVNRVTNGSPADVSEFRLDVFEVTVGRFRAFMNERQGTREHPPPEGAGSKDRPPGSGWRSSWNLLLAENTEDMTRALQCQPMNTWSTAPGTRENRPMNCVSWHEAFAFCVWDGGFLPTLAELTLASAAGSENRLYPWGNAALDDSRVVRCGTSCTIEQFLPVGSKPAGNGKWGHSDLSGSLWEWVLDAKGSLPTPCVDCANTVDDADRMRHGGDISSTNDEDFTSVAAYFSVAKDPSETRGIRCARPK